ncbi:MAG: hypothetical protein JRF52_01045 [Deltaproteobacteria bacterium]|nr:hypothetical protein [Deltaproteobacteria bacterium]
MRPKIPNRFPLLIILTFTVALLSSLMGCAPPSQVFPTVIAADAKILSKCKDLGEVTGLSGEYIPSLMRGQAASNEIQIQNAKVRALQEAADLGATDIVWGRETEGRDFEVRIKARAYKCK